MSTCCLPGVSQYLQSGFRFRYYLYELHLVEDDTPVRPTLRGCFESQEIQSMSASLCAFFHCGSLPTGDVYNWNMLRTMWHCLVVSNMTFIFHFIYGMSSFPLTFIFFKMVVAPPIRTSLIIVNHHESPLSWSLLTIINRISRKNQPWNLTRISIDVPWWFTTWLSQEVFALGFNGCIAAMRLDRQWVGRRRGQRSRMVGNMGKEGERERDVIFVIFLNIIFIWYYIYINSFWGLLLTTLDSV